MLIVKDMVRDCVIVCLINYKGFNPFRLSRLTRRHQKALSPGSQEATKTGIFDAPGCGGGVGGVWPNPIPQICDHKVSIPRTPYAGAARADFSICYAVRVDFLHGYVSGMYVKVYTALK